MFVWTALLSPAWAGPWEDLAPVATGKPDFAVTCSSAQTAWAAMGQLLGVMDLAKPDAPLADGLPWNGGSALFEPDSRLAVRFGSDDGSLLVRFTTAATSEEIARRFAGLATAGERSALLGADGWEVRSVDGVTWRVETAAGWASILRTDRALGSDPGLPPALRAAIPSPGDGCLAWMHLDGKEPFGAVDIAAQLPLVLGQPIRFAIVGDALVPLEGVFFDPQPPIEIRSTRKPDGLAILGVGLDGIDFSRVLRGGALRGARRLQRQLPITTGTVLAVLPGDPEPMIAAVLPVAGHLKAAPLARRLKRVLKALDVRAEPIDATHFVIDLQGSVFHVATVDGRILLTDDLPLLYDISQNVGDLWIQGDLAARAARYPLVLSLSVLPDPTAPQRLDPPFTLAIDLVEGVVRGETVVPLTLQQLRELGKDAADMLHPSGSPDRGEADDSAGGEDSGGGPLEDPGPLDDPAP